MNDPKHSKKKHTNGTLSVIAGPPLNLNITEAVMTKNRTTPKGKL